MSERTWDQKYAFYAASLFRLGLYIDAGLVSAILFERFIEDEIAKYDDIQKSFKGDFLRDAIDQLCQKDPLNYDRDLLHEVRKIRNQEIIHPKRIFKGLAAKQQKQEVKNKIAKITRFVWKEMDPETFDRYQKSISSIPYLQADYAVMEIKELLQEDMLNSRESNYKSIRLGDFENLFSMRDKILDLAHYTQEKLLNKFKNLDIDVISKVDTTSAYVWLAINLHKTTEDGLRDRISGASASFLATPLDFRIYLDFGGEARIEREDYYSFLQSDEGRDYLEAYAAEELDIYDIDWYSFIINREKAEVVTLPELDERISAARKLLMKAKEGKIITWNRSLLGYVIDRREITFSEIIQNMETIIKLYYYFEKYRDGVLARKVDFPWLPPNDYLLDPLKSVLNGYKLSEG
ncbi:MAG: hypothetical protein EHM79_14935 [Geobacter sp.]|nr:MAG: hypothetical protein EHM79_14935 [Geobacter sp.]